MRTIIHAATDGAVGVVVCEGPLNRAAREQLLAEAERLLNERVPRLTIDCSRATKLDADGVAALDQIATSCVSRGVACRLRATRAFLDRVAQAGTAGALSSWVSVQVVDEAAPARIGRARLSLDGTA